MPTYDPQRTAISFAGNSIVGYGGSTFLTAARTEDAFMLTIGADGRSVRTRNANRSGTIEITLLASSLANDTLAAQAVLDENAGTGTGALLFKDLTGTAIVSAQNAWIKKHADLERAKEMGEVTWIIETDFLDLHQGGTTNP